MLTKNGIRNIWLFYASVNKVVIIDYWCCHNSIIITIIIKFIFPEGREVHTIWRNLRWPKNNKI